MAFSINTKRTGPSVGRPRTAVLDGRISSAKGQSYYSPASNPTQRIPISDKLALALAALAKDPNASYDDAARAGGFAPNGKGECGHALSAAIRGLCVKVADA